MIFSTTLCNPKNLNTMPSVFHRRNLLQILQSVVIMLPVDMVNLQSWNKSNKRIYDQPMALGVMRFAVAAKRCAEISKRAAALLSKHTFRKAASTAVNSTPNPSFVRRLIVGETRNDFPNSHVSPAFGGKSAPPSGCYTTQVKELTRIDADGWDSKPSCCAADDILPEHHSASIHLLKEK